MCSNIGSRGRPICLVFIISRRSHEFPCLACGLSTAAHCTENVRNWCWSSQVAGSHLWTGERDLREMKASRCAACSRSGAVLHYMCAVYAMPWWQHVSWCHVAPLYGQGQATQAAQAGRGVTAQGIKLELFIFDTFPLAKRVALLEVHRHEEFAPVKNAPGSTSDSPDTARQAILKLHTKCESE